MDALKGILGVMEIAQDMQEKAKKGEKENRRYLKSGVLNMKYICTINLLPGCVEHAERIPRIGAFFLFKV